tara:strand:- start:2665 stop:3216 length:552 start_codon:yes stop_codon:yes gene_type:complete
MVENNDKKKLVLDLGCGKKKRDGTIGVDFNTRLEGIINHNLNEFPYPFDSETVDKVYIDNCIEHLDNPLRVMEEIHRMLKKGGEVKVIVPYFRSPYAFHDPTHKTFYTTESFSYYDPEHPICIRYDYTKAYFKVERIIFHENLKTSIIKSPIVKFANKWPSLYENRFSSFLPLDEITFFLRKI